MNLKNKLVPKEKHETQTLQVQNVRADLIAEVDEIRKSINWTWREVVEMLFRELIKQSGAVEARSHNEINHHKRKKKK